MNATTTARPPRKVSLKQVYKLAHLLIDLLGLTWPADSREASALIEKLVEQQAAAQDPADVQAEAVPF